ncbi:MAG TPA: hypothetical protein VGE39_02955 [Prosthecobacter sp.]
MHGVLCSAEWRCGAWCFPFRTVVAGEDDERFLGEVQRAEFVQDLAGAVVELLHGISIQAAL